MLDCILHHVTIPLCCGLPKAIMPPRDCEMAAKQTIQHTQMEHTGLPKTWLLHHHLLIIPRHILHKQYCTNVQIHVYIHSQRFLKALLKITIWTSWMSVNHCCVQLLAMSQNFTRHIPVNWKIITATMVAEDHFTSYAIATIAGFFRPWAIPWHPHRAPLQSAPLEMRFWAKTN